MTVGWQLVPWLLAVLSGLALGSFANVLIHRVPRGLSILSPPSSCPGCGHRIRLRENIPLLSWLLLGGRCSACRSSISARYPLVELLVALLALSIAWRLPLDWGWIPWLLVACLLTALSLIDLDTMRLPNPLVIALAAVGLAAVAAASLLAGTGQSMSGVPDWPQALLGALTGGGILLFFALLGRLWLKRDSMGAGDIKLMTALGLLLGWEKMLLCIFLASLLATIYIGLRGGKARGLEFPFGPWLALATWISFLAGDWIIAAYLRLVLI